MGLETLIRRLARARVLVVGDLMVDQFVWGKVDRVSPEAPVLVLHVDRESFHPGGAGNVAYNACALGAAVTVCGVIGNDSSGRRLRQQLRGANVATGGVIASTASITSRKTRVIAHHQQVVRFDREQRQHTAATIARLCRWLVRHAGEFDVVLVSDYGKGVVTPETLAAIAAAGGAPVVVDPKKANFAHYRDILLATPNAQEAAEAAGVEIVDDASLRAAGGALLQRWRAQAILITRGEHGMALIRAGGAVRHLPTVSRQVFDVTGAGDTVAAVCALAIAVGAKLEEAAELANHAAGIVVGKLGTATVTPAELRRSLRQGREELRRSLGEL
ncbi:MAG TPA: D-glycero-beta-D-manno-heptose-7-phosphate kinase [Terriglobales bacterium]|nr:D-glycero-beta-D-manno-heptose-7-phosphate kinase [Terriglobales bacterium]